VLGSSPAAGRSSSNGTVHFALPASEGGGELEPAFAVIDIELASPQGQATATVEIQPDLQYLAQFVDFRGSTRIIFPLVPSRDELRVSVSGGAAQVRYAVLPSQPIQTLAANLLDVPRIRETRLWRRLLAPRKRLDGEELFDPRSDPEMTRNLAEDAEHREIVRSARGNILTLWRTLSAHPIARPVDSAQAPEALEMLKSLGYVQ
jgi:hypothetical protein